MIRSMLLCAALAAIGCSSSDAASTPAADSGSTAETSGGPKVPDSSCVRPGDKGNDKGIGAPCTPLGKECDAYPGAPVCLADVGQDQWMCTRIGCTSDEQCGSGATCYKDPGGSACVPNRCLAGGGDAGSDAGGDAGGDATSDATSDAPADASESGG